MSENTIDWLCHNYEVCNVKDFKTLSALPDLLKHQPRFIKYFDLHFYNNPSDHPPSHCGIYFEKAINSCSPNLLQASSTLLKMFKMEKLSFNELAYFIHFMADLHQPFHCKEQLMCSMSSSFFNISNCIRKRWNAS